ncbi:MAG: sensor histidine kinase, partial [Thermomicrobiales bacterium]
MLEAETMETRLSSMTLRREPVNAIVEAAVTEQSGAWRDRSIVTDLTPESTDAESDRDLVTLAINNLLSNAVKYSPGGQPVLVTTRIAEDAVEIAVHDSGIGIPAEHLEAIFNKYDRVRTAQTHGIEGVGLGLPIVRAIARAHGGEVWVESVEGEGSTFHLRLARSGRAPDA